jgi:hypothetical protein
MARTYRRDSRGRFASNGTGGNLTERLRAASTAGAPRRLGFEILHHGTSASAAAAIKRGGYRESEYGALGPGVYTSSDKNTARKYAELTTIGADRNQGMLRHRLPKGAKNVVPVDVKDMASHVARPRVQAARQGGAKIARTVGDSSQTLLMSKAQADRMLDRSTGKMQVPTKRPSQRAMIEAALTGRPRPKAQRPKWNRRKR